MSNMKCSQTYTCSYKINFHLYLLGLCSTFTPTPPPTPFSVFSSFFFWDLLVVKFIMIVPYPLRQAARREYPCPLCQAARREYPCPANVLCNITQQSRVFRKGKAGYLVQFFLIMFCFCKFVMFQYIFFLVIYFFTFFPKNLLSQLFYHVEEN